MSYPPSLVGAVAYKLPRRPRELQSTPGHSAWVPRSRVKALGPSNHHASGGHRVAVQQDRESRRRPADADLVYADWYAKRLQACGHRRTSPRRWYCRRGAACALARRGGRNVAASPGTRASRRGRPGRPGDQAAGLAGLAVHGSQFHTRRIEGFGPNGGIRHAVRFRTLFLVLEV